MILKYDFRGVGPVFSNVTYAGIETGGDVLLIEYSETREVQIELSDSNCIELYSDDMKLIHKYK